MKQFIMGEELRQRIFNVFGNIPMPEKRGEENE